MSDIQNQKLRLAQDAFFRTNDDGDAILLKTDKSKVYNFTGSASYILNFFKTDYRSFTELLSEVHKDFQGITEENLQSIECLIETLLDEEILIRKNVLTADLAPSIIFSEGMFYSANSLSHCSFELTYKCNEKCRYCYCGEDDRDELRTEEIKDILDQLYEMNVLELTFTGGDPFIRRDTFEIMEYAYKKGFAFNIFTNGLALSDSDLLRIKAIHPKSIHFSIHSHIPEKHDAFTQVSGSFEKTVSTIRKCVLIGLPTNIKFTVTTHNIDDVDGVLSLAEELNTTIQVSTEVFAKNDGDASTLNYSVRDTEAMMKVYALEKRHILTKCSEGISGLKSYDEDGRPCGAGDHAINITPYGEVNVCNALQISIGDVRKQKISDIWNNSEELKQIRKIRWSDIGECGECENRELCNFCIGNAYTQHDGQLKKYENACFSTETRILYNKSRKEIENCDI